MNPINQLRDYIEQLKKEGSIRTDLPPGKEERFYNQAIETAPRAKIETVRDSHIRYMVKWAYEKSEFYRKLWDEKGIKPSDINCYEDLEKLPIWRRDSMLKDQKDTPPYGTRVANDLLPYINKLHKSVESSGSRVLLPWTLEEWSIFLQEVWGRALWICGWRPGGVYIVHVPMERGDTSDSLTMLSLKRLGILTYAEDYVGFMRNREDAINFTSLLKTNFKPICTLLSPNFFLKLGHQFERIGVDSPFDIVNVKGKAITPKMRQEIASLHKKAMLNYVYETTELILFPECSWSAERGLSQIHEPEDLYVSESVDPETGKKVSQGNRGELVVTSLFHHTMPLIRFGTEDVIPNKWTTEPCVCGITHKRWLAPVIGSVKNIFKVRGKEFLPWDVEMIIADIPSTTMIYQLILDNWDMDTLKLKVETFRDLPNQDYEREVKKILEEKLGVTVDLELVPSKTIPVYPDSFKFENVVDVRGRR
ncbi:MAG: hypothetical protein WC649_09465 [Desulfobacteria bacterium]